MTAEHVPAGGWRGDEYAAHAGHHRSYDDWFLNRHAPRDDDVVVDAGCGTGEFTVRIAELVPRGRVIGVDPDASMLEVARAHAAGNVEFRQGRLQELDSVCDAASADLVVSRAVFHWIPLEEYPRCYAAVFGVLKPGGVFHAESGGPGNVRRLTSLLDEIAGRRGLEPTAVMFPDPGVVMELLESAGFEVPEQGVTTVAQRRRFDRDGLLGFVRSQAAVAYVPTAAPERRDAFLAEVGRRLDELRHHDGTYDQTFVRLHALCRRPL
jgi:ubiquinone/menaquinone biosynthesis C-methylase UbiE